VRYPGGQHDTVKRGQGILGYFLSSQEINKTNQILRCNKTAPGTYTYSMQQLQTFNAFVSELIVPSFHDNGKGHL
jgi:hypothetical protein